MPDNRNRKRPTEEELDEIYADDNFDTGEEAGEIRSFHFSNPDPYVRVKPRFDDAYKEENGHTREIGVIFRISPQCMEAFFVIKFTQFINELFYGMR